VSKPAKLAINHNYRTIYCRILKKKKDYVSEYAQNSQLQPLSNIDKADVEEVDKADVAEVDIPDVGKQAADDLHSRPY